MFLDEISEIDPAIQVKLLRVLEEHTFERVGGEQTIEVDIRVVAATNRNLREYVEEGKFREDLFFRLNVVDITLPPLRERAGDVTLLTDRFIREFAERNSKEVAGITPEALNMLSEYSWPGNVRELRNTIEKMVVLAYGEKLTARDVPQNIREAVRGGVSLARRTLINGSLADTERQKIMAVLEKNGGNRSHAAIELGISRRTLHRKLNEYKAADEAEAAARGGEG